MEVEEDLPWVDLEVELRMRRVDSVHVGHSAVNKSPLEDGESIALAQLGDSL